MSGTGIKKAVSFVIVSYNCAEVIEDCINSVLQFGSDSVIVVDNASTDGTTSLLLPYKNRITLLLNSHNKGYTIACNQGIRESDRDYIFLLNPDAWLKNDSWTVLINILQQNTSIGAAAPNLYFPNGELQNYVRRFPTIAALLVEFFIPAKWWLKFPAYRKYTYADLDFSVQQMVEQPAGAALVFSRTYQLDEAYFIYGSDLELCRRIYADNKKIVLVPNAQVFHHQSKGGTGNSNSVLRVYLQLDALYGYAHYFRQYRSVLYAQLFRLVFALALGIVAFFSLFKGTTVFSLKYERFRGFLKGKNFRHFKR
ncbi:glycosyltransferase family 2 protein [Flavihumibacter sp. CACIAM 22H1]|uniref:glycosyltransferase family 2 protein n=1 Tax=Flavihumibacter sp. CACIAM 22H1 TaxID=1812911 RepID=UPI0007A864CF|nr:glycosyltransferase family 2 protein [Flavihumibacter sp. CACIAM 22H1]KYP15144.1 MAG: hypothetical protein A1D16_12630 [Flavihumibacter sp. CACIAM 22H1]